MSERDRTGSGNKPITLEQLIALNAFACSICGSIIAKAPNPRLA